MNDKLPVIDKGSLTVKFVSESSVTIIIIIVHYYFS